MKTHEMKLLPEPFELIASGKKDIEVRLFDEKRRTVTAGDFIVFRKLPNLEDSLTVKVAGVHVFGSFRELFLEFVASRFGRNGMTVDEFVARMHDIYSEDEEKKWGVVGIEVEG